MGRIMAKRKSDIILKSVNDLKDEIDYKDFEYKEYFNLLCELVPNNSLEKLEINAIDEKNMKNEGLVYVFVIQGKIFKIGHSITPITKRVQSYNCGKVEYRKNGTCSTTNYFVLQSLLNINEVVQVYAFFQNNLPIPYLVKLTKIVFQLLKGLRM